MDIQFAGPEGKWEKLLGHDCGNLTAMRRYVATMGGTLFRVAPDSQLGESTGFAPKPKPPVCTLTWDEFDAEEARLKEEVNLAYVAKQAAFREGFDLWRAAVQAHDMAAYQLRDLRERMGPRPSPDLEPGLLYRAIQGLRGWGYWFELGGLNVRSTLLSHMRDAAAVEVQMPNGNKISCRHEICNARGWDRYWWVIEPTREEKLLLRGVLSLG